MFDKLEECISSNMRLLRSIASRISGYSTDDDRNSHPSSTSSAPRYGFVREVERYKESVAVAKALHFTRPDSSSLGL